MENKRNGKMRRRSEAVPRQTELGYYIIFTDTKRTEKNYLTGLKDSLPPEIRDKIAISVFPTKTCDLVSAAKDEAAKDGQYRDIWIVLDRDKVVNFDELIFQAKMHGINVGWSNPCLEMWFFAYFGSMPNYETSTQLLNKFEEKYKQKTKSRYNKSDPDIYKKLTKYGDESGAIKIAQEKLRAHKNNGNTLPSAMCPATTLVDLVVEIVKHRR